MMVDWPGIPLQFPVTSCYQWIGFLGKIETGKPHDLHGKISGVRPPILSSPTPWLRLGPWRHGSTASQRWVVYIGKSIGWFGKSIVNMGKSIDWWFILKTIILAKPPDNISCDMKYGFGVTPVLKPTKVTTYGVIVQTHTKTMNERGLISYFTNSPGLLMTRGLQNSI